MRTITRHDSRRPLLSGRRHRRLAALAAASLSMTVLLATPAVAFDPGGVRTLVPAGLVGGTAVAGEGLSVGAVLGTGLIAPLDVAAGGFLIGYAAGTAGVAAVTYAWNWGKGGAGKNLTPNYATPLTLGGSKTAFMAPNYAWSAEPTGSGGAFGYPNVYGALVTTLGPGNYAFTYYRAGVAILNGVRASQLYQGAQTLFLQWDNDALPLDGIEVQSGTTVAVWGDVPGHAPATPTPAAAPPGLSTTPTSGCSDGSSVAGAAIHYSGATLGADLPPVTYPACPAGTMRTRATTPTVTDAGAPAPAPLPTWQAPVVPDAFAQCQPLGSCLLTLLRHGVGTIASPLVCNGTALCPAWQLQPRQGPVRRVQRTVGTAAGPAGTPFDEPAPAVPSGDWYSCHWGPYELAAVECQTVPTETPTPTPTPVPPGDPTPVPPAVPTPTPTPGSNCDTSDLSFNPISWVVVPLKCLFIPNPGDVTPAMAGVRDAWDRSAPGTLAGVGAKVVAPLGGLAGAGLGDCAGPTFTLHFFGPDASFSPFSACEGLPARASALILPVSTFLVYVGGLWLCTSLVLRTIGLRTPDES